MSPQATSLRWRTPSVIPGFGLSLGVTLFWLSGIVLLPLAALMVRPWTMGWDAFVQVATDPRTLAALKLSFGASLVASCPNVVFGLVVAWVLVRYKFPGRKIIDGFVDLPFALPTAVAGIALSSLYAPNGWIGAPLHALGIDLAFKPGGVVVALAFIGLPFIVRTVQPVLEDLDQELEEAAATLGATRWQTISMVVMPQIAPALVTGFALAFARSVGEYGSVIFIAGNLPGVSEIAPLLIVIKLEEFDYAGAAAVGVLTLSASFLLLLLINLAQLSARRMRS
jgi:sulfate transport system permease protein